MEFIRRIAFVLFIVILAGLAVLVALETILRVSESDDLAGVTQRDLHQLRLDRPWLFGLRPGARVTLPVTGDVLYEINDDGFRDQLRSRDVPEGHFRILVLGSSVIFGFGVEGDETFPSALEKILTERYGEGFEVLNFGINGYNAYNQAEILADVGLSFRPDLVMSEFGAAGLTNPAGHFDAQTLMHFGLIPEDAFPDPNMRSAPTVYDGLLRTCRRLRTCAWLDDIYLSSYRPKRTRAEILRELIPPDLPPGPIRNWLADRYGEMERSAQSMGAKFAIIAYPYKTQIYNGGSSLLQTQLLELCREHGWPMLDLFPDFRRAADDGATELMVDFYHPTAEGHRLAAERAADWLVQLALIPVAKTGRALTEPDIRMARPEANP